MGRNVRKTGEGTLKKYIWMAAIIILAGLFLTATAIGIWNNWHADRQDANNGKIGQSGVETSLHQVKIIDVTSRSRVYGIVFDNAAGARPQIGLSQAFIVYEFIVEGGMTRFLALFKDKDMNRIGPVRSARHYFVDYALENDAILVHYGQSPKAREDIRELNVDAINGLLMGHRYFWRNKEYVAPHNAFTKMSLLRECAEKEHYRILAEKEPVLGYSASPVDMGESDEKIEAATIRVYYSGYYAKYEYEPQNKVYRRYIASAPHIDGLDNRQLTAKNIIIEKIGTHDLTGAGKGRQDMDNIGTGEGYYVTEGHAVSIVWSKRGRAYKTIYRRTDGSELIVNDGNTFIHIQPTRQKLIINGRIV